MKSKQRSDIAIATLSTPKEGSEARANFKASMCRNSEKNRTSLNEQWKSTMRKNEPAKMKIPAMGTA